MSNSLIHETSPYLLQHSENPVNWLPWGEEAFNKATLEDKPVFLSIGYSTCHWCHVMAHESFEDEQVAQLLNSFFVPVKVDREERPDVDSVYMSVCQAVTGSGGWPLTIIMTPDKLPFFAGTYIPKQSRGGNPGLIPLLSAVVTKWRTERKSLLRSANDIVTFLKSQAVPAPSEPIESRLKAALEQLKESYDEEYGGFGAAPKFPTAPLLLFLLRLSNLSGDKSARAMVDNTLRQMYRGGIFDHFGGGFSRYSTDREWLAPHFEKTLYDNALLALVYTEAWQDGRMNLYRYVAEATLDYCLRELKAPEGGFYCGQDADSLGIEGAYYLFTPQEVDSVLGSEAGRHFSNCYDITEEGNFQGRSIPNLLLNNRWAFVPEGYDEYREKLRIYRTERMPLGTDTKMLTSWNGLMLLALSWAAWAFKDKRYLMEAKDLASFMSEKLYDGAQLKACLSSGQLRFNAQLDDYAFFALGLLELYRADFEPKHLALAQDLAKIILDNFPDPKGGFFRTGKDAEALFLRPKEVYDGALPSGNSAAALLFSQLSELTGNPLWQQADDTQLRFICGSCSRSPAAAPFGLLPLLSLVYGSEQLVVSLPDEQRPAALEAVLSRYAPNLSVLLQSPATAESLATLAPYTASMSPEGQQARYYMCKDHACFLPITQV